MFFTGKCQQKICIATQDDFVGTDLGSSCFIAMVPPTPHSPFELSLGSDRFIVFFALHSLTCRSSHLLSGRL